jgi:uncharacterized protein (TIGR03083 family)
MTSPTAQMADRIPSIGHDEAMRLTAAENERLHALLRSLDDQQWTAATDCTGWTVRDVAVHVSASAHGQANPVEFACQVLTGRRLTAEIGGSHWVDGLNEAQLRARTGWTPAMVPHAWQRYSAAALRTRRRMPAPVRALPLLPIGTALEVHIGWQPLGYLFDMGFTRDVWTHRIDIARATGTAPELTAEHDGRIVADIVAEWSRRHTAGRTRSPSPDPPAARSALATAGSRRRRRGPGDPAPQAPAVAPPHHRVTTPPHRDPRGRPPCPPPPPPARPP